MSDIYETYREKREALKLKNNLKRVEKMHSKGKLTAEERVEGFFDADTYIEMKLC